MKTNSKQVKTAVQSYITKAIDTSDYPEVKNDIKSQLEFICNEFKRVAVHKNNIAFHKTWQNVFIDWFEGLPNYFDISVYHDEIINKIMPSFGLPLPANKDEEDGVNLFYYLIFANFVDLCKKNKIDFYSYTNI